MSCRDIKEVDVMTLRESLKPSYFHVLTSSSLMSRHRDVATSKGFMKHHFCHVATSELLMSRHGDVGPLFSTCF